MEKTIYDYPFWGPQNNGPARDFSLVSGAIGAPQEAGILEDSQRLKGNHAQLGEDFNYLGFWQYPPVIIPTPQAPVTVPEQFARADSLMAYATATLGATAGMQPQKIGGL